MSVPLLVVIIKFSDQNQLYSLPDDLVGGQHNISTIPLSRAKRLISQVCRSAWDNTLHDALYTTFMLQYRRDSSPQPWPRKQPRVLDVATTRLHLGHTTQHSRLTFDLTTLLAAAGVHPSPQAGVIRLSSVRCLQQDGSPNTPVTPSQDFTTALRINSIIAPLNNTNNNQV